MAGDIVEVAVIGFWIDTPETGAAHIGETRTEAVSGQRLRSGQMERQQQRVRGPASKVTAAMEGFLRAQLESVSDRTLAELQQAVGSELQVSISLAQLWRALRKMDLRLKKSRSTPANKTAKKAVAAVRRGANR